MKSRSPELFVVCSPSTSEPAPRVPVTVKVLRSHLEAAAQYADAYNVPVQQILAAEALGQVASILDDPIATLEYLDKAKVKGDTVAVELRFSKDTHKLLSRVAKALRRPLPELIEGSLYWGLDCLDGYLKEATAKGTLFTPDMETWAKHAIELERCARRNFTPSGNSKIPSAWDLFNLQKSTRRASRQ